MDSTKFNKIIDAKTKPNFFILGAAKCGTTTLYHYLSQHPEIYFSPVKEPSFFITEYPIVKTQEEYLSLFDNAKNEKIIGEASHAYMTSPGTAEKLYKLFPNARFLIMVRNPVDRAYSLYYHMRFFGLEKIKTFEDALSAEEIRANSSDFINNCGHYIYNFLYFRSGLFGEQVQRYLSFFDKKQFIFVSLKGLQANPIKELIRIFRFLGVNESFVPDLTVKNVGKKPRFPLIHNLITNETFINFVKNNTILNAIAQSSVQRLLFSKLPPMKESTRKMLAEKYVDDLTLLKNLTGIDLNE